jgi:hypothetical protein
MDFLKKLRESLDTGKPNEELNKQFYDQVDKAKSIDNDPAKLKELQEKQEEAIKAVKPLEGEELEKAKANFEAAEAAYVRKEKEELRDARITVLQNEIDAYEKAIAIHKALIDKLKSIDLDEIKPGDIIDIS